MKLFIILIVGIFIGTWFGLLFASFVLISKKEEEMERLYWEEKQKYEEWMEEQKNE